MQQTLITAPRHIGGIHPLKTYRLSLVVVLFITMSMATLLTILFAQLGFAGREPVVNPFLAYASLFPDQPWTSALAREFLCYDTVMPSPADVTEECVFRPQTGSLSQVNITVWDGIIIRLRFAVRENSLRVGDLAMLWGTPDLQSYAQGASLYQWHDHSMVALTSSNGGRFTYFLPVSYIHFDAVGLWSKSG